MGICVQLLMAGTLKRKVILRDVQCGMLVGATRAGVSMSETVDVLGISQATKSRVNKEWPEDEKISSEN